MFSRKIPAFYRHLQFAQRPCFASCCTDVQQENLYVETINNIFFSISYRSADEIPTLLCTDPLNKHDPF